MKKPTASSNLWSNANRKTSAQHGIGSPADALYPVPLSTAKLIETINQPGHLDLLADRADQLTEEQRDAALRAFSPPKEPTLAAAPKPQKVTKAARATPPNFKGLSAARLGFGNGSPS